MRHPLRVLTVLVALAIAGSALTAASAGGTTALDLFPTYGPTFTLNPGGGVSGTDLRVTFGGAQLQVNRQLGGGELFDPAELPGGDNANYVFNQIALAVGDSVDGGTAFVSPAFFDPGTLDPNRVRANDNVTLLPWSVSATATATQITEVLTGIADGRTYTVTVVLTYTAPDDRMRFDYSVVVPAGNTKPVRLYHLIDSFLGGWDEGPGFFDDPRACGTSGESGAVVGADRADLGVVEAFQYVSGPMWAGYMSAFYRDVVFGGSAYAIPPVGPGRMNDLNEQIITDPQNDNGFGVNWNFGATPGTYNAANKLIFSTTAVDPCADPAAVSPTNPDPSVVPDPDIEPDVPNLIFDDLKDELPVVGPKYTG